MKKTIENRDVENVIYTALNNNKNLWRSVDEVAAITGVTSNEVFKTINQSDKFVLTSDAEQHPIITTRERYRNEEPFIKRLVGAFKNRID